MIRNDRDWAAWRREQAVRVASAYITDGLCASLRSGDEQRRDGARRLLASMGIRVPRTVFGRDKRARDSALRGIVDEYVRVRRVLETMRSAA